MALAGLNSGGILHSTQQQCGGSIPLAIAFNSLWLLMTLVPFALVIRYGVITREEAYLERKFGDVYRRYHTRVRRWL